jgi:adenylosuccinate lyase
VTDKPRIPNVLAGRYASEELVLLWSPENKVRLERELWLAVLRAQKELGVHVPDGVIGAHRGVQRAGRARACAQGDDLARPH